MWDTPSGRGYERGGMSPSPGSHRQLWHCPVPLGLAWSPVKWAQSPPCSGPGSGVHVAWGPCPKGPSDNPASSARDLPAPRTSRSARKAPRQPHPGLALAYVPAAPSQRGPDGSQAVGPPSPGSRLRQLPLSYPDTSWPGLSARLVSSPLSCGPSHTEGVAGPVPGELSRCRALLWAICCPSPLQGPEVPARGHHGTALQAAQ